MLSSIAGGAPLIVYIFCEVFLLQITGSGCRTNPTLPPIPLFSHLFLKLSHCWIPRTRTVFICLQFLNLLGRQLEVIDIRISNNA